MHRRLYRIIAALTFPVLAGGCAQMTRHSNMVLFGTNSSIGVRVGASASSVPEIQIGYARQEAVAMPLVANVRHKDDGGTSGDLLQPCDLTSSVQVQASKYAVHPCSLVAVNGSALDSYSVLASFGAKLKGSASTGDAEAGVGLAQYFATGMAAQMLALNGGAAVVAVSQAAENSALTPPSGETIKALYSNPQAFQLGVERNDAYEQFRTKLLSKVAATNQTVLAKRIGEFETAVGSNEDLASDCAGLITCIDTIRGNDPYRTDYPNKRQAYDGALEAWNINP